MIMILSVRTPGLFLLSCLLAHQLPAITGAQIILSQMQNFSNLPVEFHEVSVVSILQPVQVYLSGSTALSCLSHSLRFFVCKFVEGPVSPIAP